MLAGFWNHPATQDLITDAICYDGTYDHTERQWCLDNVLAAREFCITWEAGCALLDAGSPFAMATVEVIRHLQAVVGYDAVREDISGLGSLKLLFREALVDKLLKSTHCTGRGVWSSYPKQRNT